MASEDARGLSLTKIQEKINMQITNKRIKTIEKMMGMHIEKDSRIVFIGWNEDIDKKVEKEFMEKKAKEIATDSERSKTVQYVFLDKKELEKL